MAEETVQHQRGDIRSATPERGREGRDLAVILTVATAIRLLAYQGMDGADDLFVAQLAMTVLDKGAFIGDTIYSLRVGMFYPLAGVFALFGVGEWQMALLPLLASLAGITLARALGAELGNQRIGNTAAWLLALFPLDVLYATRYFPDLLQGVLLALVFYLCLTAPRARRPWLHGIIAGLLWGWAFEIKIDAALFGAVLPLLARRVNWRLLAVPILVFAGVLLAENTFYYTATGTWNYQMKVISGLPVGPAASQPAKKEPQELKSKAKQVNEAMSMAQLWVFPKAWFITFYEFGLHYYLLFAALIGLTWQRRWEWLPLGGWVVLFLLWLEFGGNPFSIHDTGRTHLLRYCAALDVPMAVLTGAWLSQLRAPWPRRTVATLTAGAALFFIVFNTLNSERLTATRRAMDHVLAQELFPLYLDATSYNYAQFLLRTRALSRPIHPVQIKLQPVGGAYKTGIPQLAGKGRVHLLLNPGFLSFQEQRYGLASVAVEEWGLPARKVHQVDNPMSPLAYAEARLLVTLGSLLPVPFLRDKITETGKALLQGGDAVVWEING